MATYALPLGGSVATSPRNHIHTQSHSHSRSHRKAVAERINENANDGDESYGFPNGGSPLKTLHSHDTHNHHPSRSLPLNSIDEIRRSNSRHFHTNSTIPVREEQTTMDRRHGKPVAPLNLKQSNYGFSEVSIKGPSLEEGHGLTPERKESNHWELRNITSELISSVLIPIPYLLGSLTRTASLLDPENPIDPSQMGVITDLLWTARVSSLALLITGIVAKNGQKRIESNSRNATLGHAKEKEDSMKSLLSPSKAGLFGQRILQMGLPFYACTQLGGVAVAEVQLVALAGDLYSATKKLHEDKSSLNTWKYLILSKKWAIAAIIMQAFSKSIPGLANTTLQEIILGYSTLVLGILFFPPPFPSSIHNRGAANGSVPEDQPKQRLSLRNRSYSAVQTSTTVRTGITQLAELSPKGDTNLTLMTGMFLSFVTYVHCMIPGNALPVSLYDIIWLLIIGGFSASQLLQTHSETLRNSKNIGLGLGLAICASYEYLWHPLSFPFVFIPAFVALSLWSACTFGVTADSLSSDKRGTNHHARGQSQSHSSHPPHSRITGFLLARTESWHLLHSILSEKDSRRIFYFMCLNFAFMMVQTFYAVVTGSLGLLSDSIHMLFDCLALVVGLCAAVMSKWPPSTRFPYGFGKMDTLAGFANGVFLMLISVEIIYEAVERLVEGSQMQRIGELLTVSSLGLVVNLVGITAFGHAHHGHGHSHDHGHDHAEAHQHEHESHRHHDHHHDHNHEYEHSHHSHGNGHVHEENRPPGSLTQSVPNTGNGSISPLPFSIPSTPSILTAPQSAAPQAPSQSHKSHSHGHHHHGNENMHGIFLHILADTLGSVAVVISSILIEYTGWSGFDPLASCLIAILIFASAVPLVTSSARILLLTVPDSTEFDLREALAGVGSLRGVVGVRAPRFWMSDGNDQVIGVMHVIAGRGIELDDVRERASRFLKDRSMDILIQVEREGDGRCWCGGGA